MFITTNQQQHKQQTTASRPAGFLAVLPGRRNRTCCANADRGARKDTTLVDSAMQMQLSAVLVVVVTTAAMHFRLQLRQSDSQPFSASLLI